MSPAKPRRPASKPAPKPTSGRPTSSTAASSSKDADAPASPGAVLTLGALASSMLGRRTLGACPSWPPDVFAIAASLLRRTGGYVDIVERWRPPSGWSEAMRRVASAWRETAVQRSAPPKEVALAWRTLETHRAFALGAGRPPLELVDALMRLFAAADETAHDLGTTSAHPYVREAELPLALRASLGREVSAQVVTVLPKVHTPRAGMTLRSLSHHLCALEVPDVTPHWLSRPGRQAIDRLSVLLLPWPLEMSPRAFSPGRSDAGFSPGHATFHYEARPFDKERALSAIDEANRLATSPIDLVVLPEQALTEAEATELAEESGVIVITGVHGGEHARENASLVCDPTLPRERMVGLRARAFGHGVSRFRQAKHHRWCLDEGQIRRYGLTACLDPKRARAYWEDIALNRREVYFHALDGDLTYSVLVCEDLARQDPLADVLRAVGPSLIFALLLDGPQLKHRWPARYAAVLAEDPGSSVLTLTSYGMAQLSRPPSPVIALFGDGATGEITELALGPGAVGLVVTLARNDVTEETADSRQARSHSLRIESVLDVHERPRSEGRAVRRLAAASPESAPVSSGVVLEAREASALYLLAKLSRAPKSLPAATKALLRENEKALRASLRHPFAQEVARAIARPTAAVSEAGRLHAEALLERASG